MNFAINFRITNFIISNKLTIFTSIIIIINSIYNNITIFK